MDMKILIECCEDDCGWFHIGNWGDEAIYKHEKLEEKNRKFFKGFKHIEYWNIK